MVIAFSESVGSIRSTDATLKVTALVAEDSADASRRMRGVKLTLHDNGGNDHVWLDESELAKAQCTASCWMPAHPQRIRCYGFVVGPDGSRMTLGAYGADGIRSTASTRFRGLFHALKRRFFGWVYASELAEIARRARHNANVKTRRPPGRR